jgi:cytochrome c oxidase subunit 2
MMLRLFTYVLGYTFVAAAAFGSTGEQSALNSAGIQAERLESLWWLFFYICSGVYVIVMAVLIVAILRRRRASAETVPDTNPSEAGERRSGYVVKGAVAVTVVTLFALMVTSFRTGSAISSLQAADDPLMIKITGNQWWWNVEYSDPTPSNSVQTANEIHLPIGRPVQLELNSTDVIHSFWLPNMHGKKDLIPNYPTTFFFRPDKIGTYSGQCAEFCGYQHAKMRFTVVVESAEDFDAWYAAQQQVPPAPSNALAARGQQLFLTTTCIQCHTVQGTPANGRVGPNLTHVATRPFLAAGSLENTDDNLRAWITDPQAIKPGNRMPMNTYSDEDLNALVAYIETLK